MKILIADDDYSSRQLLTGILSPHGECVCAQTGLEALELFKTASGQASPFDLVCMDIMMPEMDGQTALTNIRKFEKSRHVLPDDEVIVIMTTALDSLQTVVGAFEGGGCNAYLTKPITKRVLLEKIKKYGLIDP